MSNEKQVLTNKEKALQLMDTGFGFLDQVSCKGADLDNMARGRECLRRAWELLHTPDKNLQAEVKNDG